MAGLGLLSAAVFPTDPVSGYPPGTPPAPPRPSRTGIAHNLSAIPFFAGLPAAALSGAGFGQSPGLVPVAGLLHRVSIITGQTWLTTLSAQVLRD